MIMTSPARAHFMRVSAASLEVGAAAGTQNRPDINQYELMLAKLAEDKRRLKDVQSIERKAEVKAALLPEYMPWIEGVLEGDTGRQDEVFMTAMVWAIDIADFPLALRCAGYALKHKLVLPDQYKRTLGCLLVEEFSDLAGKAFAADQPVDRAMLYELGDLTAGEDMPDEVRAKLYKAIGYAERQAGNPVTAKEFLQRALQLHDKVGVKKDIERLDVEIKNLAGAQQSNS